MVTDATTRIRQLARQPYPDHPSRPANGRPIATGVIEATCRHLTQDRTGTTGTR
jgi:hypothetical protein